MTQSIAQDYGALYPEELVARYASGERDFARINLLRAELEYIADERGRELEVPAFPDDRFNTLWSDFRALADHEFEWDGFGHFIPIEFNDMLPSRDLRGAQLAEANLDGSYLYPIDFSGANLHRSSLRRAMLFDVNLQGADLSYADLRGATIGGDLSGANLYMARLEGSRLSGTAAGCNLGRAKLRRANLGALDLRRASFANAHFDETNLNRADLRGVSFDNVGLSSVYLTGVRLDTEQIDSFLRSLDVALDGTGGPSPQRGHA